MMAIIIGMYYGFYVPSVIDYLVDYDQNVKRYMFHVFNAIFYFNAIINPAIYAWVNKDFRNAFGKILPIKRTTDVNRSVAMGTSVAFSTQSAQSSNP